MNFITHCLLIEYSGVCSAENKVLIACMGSWYAIAIYGVSCPILYLLPSACNRYEFISKYPLQRVFCNGKSFMCIFFNTNKIFDLLNPQSQSEQSIVISSPLKGSPLI